MTLVQRRRKKSTAGNDEYPNEQHAMNKSPCIKERKEQSDCKKYRNNEERI